MRAVSIRQLWGRAWDFFKGHWLLFVGLYVLLVIVTFISINALIFGLILLIFGGILSPFLIVGFIGFLIVPLILTPAFVRAGYLVARKGQSSFGEAFGDLSLLLKVFVYDLILRLIPGILTGMGVYRVLESVVNILAAAPAETEKDYGAMIASIVLGETVGVLIGAGLVIFFILYLFGWAGPYAILSGRAGVFRAIGQSFSLTWWNFSKVFVALLSVIGLLLLGLLLLELGLLMKVPDLILLIGWLLCGLGLLVVGPMWYVFLPLLYLALTGEEGASHA